MGNQRMKTARFILIAVVGSILLLGYSNCAKDLTAVNVDSSTISNASSLPQTISSGNCDQDLKLLFDSGYHAFAMTNCSLCHNVGPGKGRFATADLDTAFKDFMQLGYTDVSDHATSSSHNPPYTGAQNILAINELRASWQKGLADYDKCKGVTSTTTEQVDLNSLLTLETTGKPIPTLADGANAFIEWDLSKELLARSSDTKLPSIGATKFNIRVGRYTSASGESYYTFTLPHIYSNPVDLHIKTIQVKINGRLLTFPTTFRFVDTGIYQNSKNDSSGLITTGSLVAPGAFSSKDFVAFAFETIEPTTLTAPPPPVTVNFTNAKYNWVTSTSGFADVSVSLSRAADTLVVASASAINTGICTSKSEPVDISKCDTSMKTFICSKGSCPNAQMLARARSVVGTTYNRFDWDYKFDSTSFSFRPGELTKTIRIYFSTDTRKEANRLLTLQLDADLSGAVRGSNYEVNFITDKISNPVPPDSVASFSELMSPTGVLGFNCVKCHNSRDLNGGYDMTNYDLMRTRGIIIPYNVDSLMFARMNPGSAKFDYSNPMPKEGQLPIELRKEVENWIKAGAPNN